MNSIKISLNQVGVQAMLGGLLIAFTLLGLICFMSEAMLALEGESGNPIAYLLFTLLMGALSKGRIDCSERNLAVVSKHIDENS